ncbi:MAG: hypothetical protein ABII18_02410, partial [bacterium]
MSRVQPYGQKPAEEGNLAAQQQDGKAKKRGKTSARERNTGIEPQQDGRTSSKGKAYEILSSEEGAARTAEMKAKHAEDKGARESAQQERVKADAEKDAKACKDTTSVLSGAGAVVGIVGAIGIAAGAAGPFGWIVSIICAVIVAATLIVSGVQSAKQKDAAAAAEKGAKLAEQGLAKGQELNEEYTKEGGVADQIEEQKETRAAAKAERQEARAAGKAET